MEFQELVKKNALAFIDSEDVFTVSDRAKEIEKTIDREFPTVLAPAIADEVIAQVKDLVRIAIKTGYLLGMDTVVRALEDTAK